MTTVPDLPANLPEQSGAGASLRQLAEEQLARQPVPAEVSMADALYLLHELQVHQIELQVQNEALQKSEAEARDALNRLNALHGKLEQEVLDRTAALLDARLAAEAANRAKSVFLSNMSHELRTPLNGVMGMVGLALGRATDVRQIDWLQKASRSAAHLLSIINDVLDLSKVEADKLTLAYTDFRLGSVLELLTDLLGVQAAEKGLALSVELAQELADCHLLGDAQRLGQVLLNLTGNAIKFTDAGSVQISVSLLAHLADEVMLRFEVRDTGLGIAAADQARLFHEFEQIDDSSTRRRGGTGLGLVISKRMIELMHGEIGVDSVPGVGSSFWFTARLGMPVPAPRSAAVPPAPTLPDARARLISEFAGTPVLLAEDNPINQQVMATVLGEAGLVVSVAEHGGAALAQAQASGYGLILMDLQMPVLDGMAATRAIRQIPAHAHTPIVALTSSAFEHDRLRCLEAGMDDHLAKPVDPAELYSVVLKWLRARAAVSSH